jgi:hypothetical protein
MNGVPEKRVRVMLQKLYRVALVIVTVVCAGIVGSSSGGASISVIASTDTATATTWVFGHAQSYRSRGRLEASLETDLKAVESDIDDVDTLCGIADALALSRGDDRFSRTPPRLGRGEDRGDPSRFAVGTGLPRGPPA